MPVFHRVPTVCRYGSCVGVCTGKLRYTFESPAISPLTTRCLTHAGFGSILSTSTVELRGSGAHGCLPSADRAFRHCPPGRGRGISRVVPLRPTGLPEPC